MFYKTLGAAHQLFYDPIGQCLDEEKGLQHSALWGLFWAPSLYLEMSEQVGRTQRSGEYCKKVCRWILRTCKGEIVLIFELPLGFSVAKAGAGAKNGDFCRGIRDYF